MVSLEENKSSDAFLGQAVESWRKQVWKLPLEKLTEDADKMKTDGNNLLLAHLPGGNHISMRFVVNEFKALQDWLFEQSKKKKINWFNALIYT